MFRDNKSILNFTEFKLFTGVSELEDYAFSNCGLARITFPESITTVRWRALEACDNLVEIKINEGATTFNSQCFRGRSGLPRASILKTIIYPSTTAFIANRVHQWGVIESMTILAVVPPKSDNEGSYMFQYAANVPPNIYVPAEAVDAYKADELWGRWSSKIQAIPE